MTQPPSNPGGRHLDPEEFAKAMAEQLAATPPPKRSRIPKLPKPKKSVERKGVAVGMAAGVAKGSKADGAVVGRLVSWTAIVGLCFGAGVGIAALVVWVSGALPGSATEVSSPDPTFPGQVVTTIDGTVVVPPSSSTTTPEDTTTTEGAPGVPIPSTTVPGTAPNSVPQAPTTTRPGSPATTSPPGTTPQTAPTTPTSPTTSSTTPTTTSTTTSTTSTTTPTTTSTTAPPSAVITSPTAGQSYTAGNPGPGFQYTCISAPSCVGEVSGPGGGPWTTLAKGAPIPTEAVGTYTLRVLANPGGTPIGSPRNYTVNP